MLCPESSVSYFGNLSCRGNVAKCTKTRISKSEIRLAAQALAQREQYQNPNAQNSKQKRDGIGICVLVIDIFVIRSLFRASIFEFRISPSLLSGLNTPNQRLFQIAISG